jgi:flavin reductase (DIM6/NTAB) family NADH-FMN oxidoreductase RutF
MALFATGVTIVTVRDGRDDIGSTVTAFTGVSLDPPMVLVSIAESSYLAEVLRRQERWAVTVLSAAQRALAGRFAAEGRPSARLLLAGEPHHRGAQSGALIAEGGRVAMECLTRQRVGAGDHVLFIAEVVAVDGTGSMADRATPLIRFDHRYRR